MIFFAFVAGLLSILSPCVLPLIPIVLGTALSQHRFGPVALAFGVAVLDTAGEAPSIEARLLCSSVTRTPLRIAVSPSG